MITELLIVSEVVSAGLALVLVYLFLKAYRLRRSVFLLGLPFGFSFLAVSYIFLGVSLGYGSDQSVSDAFLWLRLFTQSFGFAFIAFSYFFSSRAQRTAKYFFAAISLTSFVSVVSLFGLLVVMPPVFQVPPVGFVDEVFRVANLLFLGYVVFFLIRRLEFFPESVSELVSAPIAFLILAVAQFSSFIWGIDGSLTALVAAHVARIISLILFIRIYFLTERAGDEAK